MYLYTTLEVDIPHNCNLVEQECPLPASCLIIRGLTPLYSQTWSETLLTWGGWFKTPPLTESCLEGSGKLEVSDAEPMAQQHACFPSNWERAGIDVGQQFTNLCASALGTCFSIPWPKSSGKKWLKLLGEYPKRLRHSLCVSSEFWPPCSAIKIWQRNRGKVL